MSNDPTTETAAHADASTLTVQIYDPEHAQRITTPQFTKTRDEVLSKEPLCWLCGLPKETVGPLELHHNTVERMFAEIIDWQLVKAAAMAGEVGWTTDQRELNKTFDWDAFIADVAADGQRCYDYVDNMHLNGIPLCKPHHTGKDEGIHMMDYPRWLAQRYIAVGYKYSDVYTEDAEDVRLKAITEDDAASVSDDTP